jgi:phage pi2 protein 07
MQKPKHTKHNDKEVKVLLDKDKDYQDIQDEHDTDWWHQLDLEIEEQLETEKIIQDLRSSTCPRG